MGNKNTEGGRYYASPEYTAKKIPIYAVIDRITGERMAVRDCMLWAEHKAEELNKKDTEETE